VNNVFLFQSLLEKKPDNKETLVGSISNLFTTKKTDVETREIYNTRVIGREVEIAVKTNKGEERTKSINCKDENEAKYVAENIMGKSLMGAAAWATKNGLKHVEDELVGWIAQMTVDEMHMDNLLAISKMVNTWSLITFLLREELRSKTLATIDDNKKRDIEYGTKIRKNADNPFMKYS